MEKVIGGLASWKISLGTIVHLGEFWLSIRSFQSVLLIFELKNIFRTRYSNLWRLKSIFASKWIFYKCGSSQRLSLNASRFLEFSCTCYIARTKSRIITMPAYFLPTLNCTETTKPKNEDKDVILQNNYIKSIS